ncbi:MAG: FAD-dependent oxidoreductase [Deltaproteobacteria bacterium]|nr:FAD-dependent oxidoreductase [Deltaproteobacteria bacterium]
MKNNRYDTIVIGGGPAGQRAALELARHGVRTAIVESRAALGGTCLHEGTIPSKALRTAIIIMSNWRYRKLVGQDQRPLSRLDGSRLLEQVDRVIEKELQVIQDLMERNNIDLVRGRAGFTGTNTIRLDDQGIELEADSFILAAGSVGRKLDWVPYDGTRVIDSDSIYAVVDPLPGSMTIVGTGVVGMEYAMMLALAGVKVHMVGSSGTALGFVDQELVRTCLDELEFLGGQFHPNCKVRSVEAHENSAVVHMDSGESIESEIAMFSVGRQASTADMSLEAAGVETDDRGVVIADSMCRTSAPNIYAAGDIIGPPSLASTSREQGRLAALSLLGLPAKSMDERFIPYGIYTIPEMAWVGKRGGDGSGLVTGRAMYKHLAKGEMLGEDRGFIKLSFDPDTRVLLGAGAVGTDAAELIHVAKLLVEMQATLDDLLAQVFNYPTLAEAYKVAAMDAEAALR